jgi:UDP-N-acetylglucosamine 1-carboxyvinyltransferase
MRRFGDRCALSRMQNMKEVATPHAGWDVFKTASDGGDAIGSRGLDFHINGLKDMGAEIHSEHGFVIASAPNGIKGAAITLEFPSVGATENIMTAATLATGRTTIDNAAREPDVVDLGEFLITMGN